MAKSITKAISLDEIGAIEKQIWALFGGSMVICGVNRRYEMTNLVFAC